jgi:hypothetical protein
LKFFFLLFNFFTHTTFFLLMPVQMVSRFRVKKLSPKHPLPIFKESQLPDIVDPANVQRSVPQIETGVEKEEEEEVNK